MATAEKESILKNMKIKIKTDEDKNSPNSKNRYNISGSNEMKEEDKDSSKVSREENKEIINLNMISPEKDSKSDNTINSKVIKEKPEEIENAQNNESKSSDNIENKENKSSEIDNENNNSDNNEKDNSSFLNSNHYNINTEGQNEGEEEEETDNNNYLNRKDPFMTTGKFMQIHPHFTLSNQRIDILKEGIYDNTKKCLMYKSSLQMSENLMRERANSIAKEFVDKLYNLRAMFLNSVKEVSNIMKETNKGMINLNNIQNQNKNELKDSDFRINRCERQIGYKLLGKPNFSFMRRAYNTTTNKK